MIWIMKVKFMSGLDANAPVVDWDEDLFVGQQLEREGQRFEVTKVHKPGAKETGKAPFFVATLKRLGKVDA